MIWPSWDAFWAMGGYGFFVWSSYAMVILVIAIEVAALGVRRRRAIAALARDAARARVPS